MNKKSDGPFLGRMPLYNSLSVREKQNVAQVWNKPLSGYLGGVPHAGHWVERLSRQWENVFRCDYAIPCNSATSGLLAACMAAGVSPGDIVWVSAYTMSATASAPMVLGASVVFKDIEPGRFGMSALDIRADTPTTIREGKMPKAIIVTNLFGHPAYLHNLRAWCDENGVVMIEDNAQGPLATENGVYAGTIGHMGVFSLNVHKHIQCGEGGMVTTNNPSYREALQAAINHGELAGLRPGLNLRMTEPIAAIACGQITRVYSLVESRRELARSITDIFKDIPWVYVPGVALGCESSYYVWPAVVHPGTRHRFVKELNRRGVPIKAGYITPLHKLFKRDQTLTTVETVENNIIIFETCAYDPNKALLKQMKQVVEYVAERLL